MKNVALKIIDESIKGVLPREAVIRILKEKNIDKEVVIISIGKAAWNMASAAVEFLGNKVISGAVITKYGHSNGPIKNLEIHEAGHPIPDYNSVIAANRAIEHVSNLTNQTQVLLLISGGGSSLFEKPMDGVELEEVIKITDQLLKCGANIVEINTIRKHLSSVKGGRFAKLCGEASLFSIILSDVVGDRLDSIASGPAILDESTSIQALNIIEKYNIKVSNKIIQALKVETPKTVNNCESIIAGSVTALCESAARKADSLGFKPLILSTSIESEARKIGEILSSIARDIKNSNSKYNMKAPCAIILGGESVVKVTGNGKGGRNQEIALSSAFGIQELEDVMIVSFGSDGTDGPTNAAGGIVDGGSIKRMIERGLDPEKELSNNNSYYALKASGDLIISGPTGTNVNDLMMILIK